MNEDNLPQQVTADQLHTVLDQVDGGFWISPEGVFHPVYDECGHYRVAYSVCGEDSYQTMHNLGYIHVGMYKYSDCFVVSVSIHTATEKSLKSLRTLMRAQNDRWGQYSLYTWDGQPIHEPPSSTLKTEENIHRLMQAVPALLEIVQQRGNKVAA